MRVLLATHHVLLVRHLSLQLGHQSRRLLLHA